MSFFKSFKFVDFVVCNMRGREENLFVLRFVDSLGDFKLYYFYLN